MQIQSEKNNQKSDSTQGVYPHRSLEAIMQWCQNHNKELWQYVEEYEGKGIRDYLEQIAKVMEDAVERGLATEGLLP